jgi:hypothetical protein
VNAPQAVPDWTTANQKLLVAEFARIRCLLRGDDPAGAQAELDALREAMPEPAAVDRIAERFGLSAFERDVLLLAAGFEMDAEIGASCMAPAADPRRARPTFALALAVLPAPHWSALTPGRPLRRWRLVDVADAAMLVAAPLRVDERVLHYLAGVDDLDTRLRPILRPVPVAHPIAQPHERIADDIVAMLAREESPLPAVQLLGNDRHGKRDVAAAAARRCGLRLFMLAADDLPAAAPDLAALTALWEREAALLDAALLVEADDATAHAALRFVDAMGGLAFVAVREPLALERSARRYRVEKPGADEQLRLWHFAFGAGAPRLAPALEAIAAELSLSASEIHRVAETVRRGTEGDAAARLWDACRTLDDRRLGSLAQRIEPAASWDDLVLPDAQRATLREIGAHLRHRLTVLERWGFAARSSRGLGLAVLFSGESGTGKTMAAEVLARELRLELYRIDLSSVVSKYIGETEKNLARVFDAAEDSGAILLFDEADALFGKRSEVKDSHDRYANIEVSYLLQRMEAYRGLAILTTNQKAALDPAFLRRLRFVVQFPFPDAAEREAIWRRTFPDAAPRHDIDYARLARLHATGGSIRSIALNAAFLAAAAGEPIGMRHLLDAARAEAGKRERVLTDGETRGWV